MHNFNVNSGRGFNFEASMNELQAQFSHLRGDNVSNGDKQPSNINTFLKQDNSHDEILLKKFPVEIISGYLNLSKNEGWPEGFDSRIGATFTRYIFSTFLLLKGDQLHQHKDKNIFEKVMKAFQNIGELTLYGKEPTEGYRPKTSRVCYDSGIEGWKGHAISRMVGNLASEYSKEKPFFEILVNSARAGDRPTCQPFFITIYANEKELDERRKSLSCLKNAPPELAQHTFYTKYYKNPENFLTSNETKLGPNSTRIIHGLQYLQKTTINSQKAGNCWIKQPMRCLLASLYLELFSAQKELTPEEAMKGAKACYKKVQKNVAIPFAIELLNSSNKITSRMLESANIAIENQKKL